MRITFSIEKTGSLYCLLNSFLCAYRQRTVAMGKGLNAIALALSTPQDNTAQVQAEIDNLTAQLNASTDNVEDAINEQRKED